MLISEENKSPQQDVEGLGFTGSPDRIREINTKNLFMD
jgi:hypothetical protein